MDSRLAEKGSDAIVVRTEDTRDVRVDALRGNLGTLSRRPRRSLSARQFGIRIREDYKLFRVR